MPQPWEQEAAVRMRDDDRQEGGSSERTEKSACASYGGEWPRDRFRAHGITSTPAETAKSDLLSLVNSGQLCDSIDHVPHRFKASYAPWMSCAISPSAHEQVGCRSVMPAKAGIQERRG